MVDFAEVDLEQDHVLHIRPGQIHQWRAEPDYQGTLLLFQQFRQRPQAHWPSEPTAHALGVDQLERLESAYRTYWSLVEPNWVAVVGGSRHDLALAGLRDVFQAVLGIPPSGHDSAPGGGGPYFELRADIERHLDHHQTVQDRAARLGYSTRTLDRACRAVVGLTAKRLVDERLALEARRMLVLPNSQVSAVARSLGFDEATNFTKFVKRTTGRLPSDWQDPQSPVDRGR